MIQKEWESLKVHRIPEATVMRLSIYSRYLNQLRDEGVETISSGEIAKGVGVGSAQVRKDLAYFGEFGTRGVGYKVEELFGHLMKILGIDQNWKVIIIGAGKLGSALALYQGFKDRGFAVCAILDDSTERIGQKLANVEIEPLERMQQRIQEYNIQLGIVTVQEEKA